MDTIRIVADLHIKPDALQTTHKLLQDMAAASQREAGNVAYIIAEDAKNATHIIILEEWKSAEAIASHNKMEHFREFQKKIAPFVEKSSVTTLKRLY